MDSKQVLGHNPLKERCDGLIAYDGIEDYSQNFETLFFKGYDA